MFWKLTLFFCSEFFLIFLAFFSIFENVHPCEKFTMTEIIGILNAKWFILYNSEIFVLLMSPWIPKQYNFEDPSYPPSPTYNNT